MVGLIVDCIVGGETKDFTRVELEAYLVTLCLVWSFNSLSSIFATMGGDIGMNCKMLCV